MSNQRVFVELKQKKNKKKKPEVPRQVGSPALAGFLTVCGEVFLAVAENMKKDKKKKNKEAGRAAEQPDELTQDLGPEPILPSPEVIGDPITAAIKELVHKGESKD